MAGRPKGQQKTGGRVKGVPNKMTGNIRDMLAAFLSKKIKELPRIWDTLDGKEKVECMAKFMPYIAPKLESVSFDGSANADIKIKITKSK